MASETSIPPQKPHHQPFKPPKNQQPENQQKPQNSNINRNWSIADFEIGKPLGKGKFGRVYLAREIKVFPPISGVVIICSFPIVILIAVSVHDFRKFGKHSKYMVALKVIFKVQIEKYKLHHQLSREMEIQTSLDHPNVLRLYGWFHDDERIFLILEYAFRG